MRQLGTPTVGLGQICKWHLFYVILLSIHTEASIKRGLFAIQTYIVLGTYELTTDWERE